MGSGSAAAAPAPDHGNGRSVVVHRGGHDATVPFTARRGGEVELDVSASAPDADWSRKGDESAVVSVYADGKYATDIVIPFAQPIVRHLVLGTLRPGLHLLRLHFAGDRSAAGVHLAVLSGFHFVTYAAHDAGYLTARYTPVLYGRNLAEFGGRWTTRTPTPRSWRGTRRRRRPHPGTPTCSTRSSGATRTAAPTPRS